MQHRARRNRTATTDARARYAIVTSRDRHRGENLRAMGSDVGALLELAKGLEAARDLADMLRTVVVHTAGWIGVERVSVRVLDETGRHLLVGARSGEPMHRDADIRFVMGEGLVGWVAEHASVLRLGRADEDPRFVARPEMRARMRSFLGAPLVVGGACIGVLAAVSPEMDLFRGDDEERLVLACALCAPHVQIARLRHLSQVDPLTGALNRRGFDAWRAPSGTPGLAIATIDLDHFKDVNDRFGHGVGDEVLRAVAAILATVLRRDDAIVRLGGEEFLLVLPGAGIDDASSISERARNALESRAFTANGASFHITASIGVAAGPVEEPLAVLVDRADAAMYEAKRAGRNRVVRAA